MKFTVRTWEDYYNERGQYRQNDMFCNDLQTARELLFKGERGLILVEDPGKICSKIVESVGFL